ncbi:hypothetical protein HispidOSU_010779, partial [Sigmodon hispidus]
DWSGSVLGGGTSGNNVESESRESDCEQPETVVNLATAQCVPPELTGNSVQSGACAVRSGHPVPGWVSVSGLSDPVETGSTLRTPLFPAAADTGLPVPSDALGFPDPDPVTSSSSSHVTRKWITGAEGEPGNRATGIPVLHLHRGLMNMQMTSLPICKS